MDGNKNVCFPSGLPEFIGGRSPSESVPFNFYCALINELHLITPPPSQNVPGRRRQSHPAGRSYNIAGGSLNYGSRAPSHTVPYFSHGSSLVMGQFRRQAHTRPLRGARGRKPIPRRRNEVHQVAMVTSGMGVIRRDESWDCLCHSHVYNGKASRVWGT
jgi:hypothetical protein